MGCMLFLLMILSLMAESGTELQYMLGRSV